MVRECSFILPNGRQCGCAATRNQSVCRHHAPKPAVPGPPPPSRYDRYSDLIRWRRLSSNLQWMPVGEIPLTVYEILQCLIDRGRDSTGHISDRTAGRYLRVLLGRLGDVPFPDPDLDPPAPSLNPSVAAPRATAPASLQDSDPAPSMAELTALLASFGAPSPRPPLPSQPPLSQSRTRLHQ